MHPEFETSVELVQKSALALVPRIMQLPGTTNSPGEWEKLVDAIQDAYEYLARVRTTIVYAKEQLFQAPRRDNPLNAIVSTVFCRECL